MSLVDLTGIRFGRLVALNRSENLGKETTWSYRCDCGTVKVVRTGHLRSGRVKSCRCWRREEIANRTLKHGAARRSGYTPEYTTWMLMVQRCHGEHGRRDSRYGGRGISVCDRWRESFDNFLADMGPKPGPGYSIDRIRNDGDYEPGTCRWATHKEQARHKRNSRYLTYRGRTLCVAEWAEVCGLNPQTILKRLARGWSIERTLSEAA